MITTTEINNNSPDQYCRGNKGKTEIIWAWLACSGLLALILYKKKNCAERTYKVRNFWATSVIESQKAEEDSNNKESRNAC